MAVGPRDLSIQEFLLTYVLGDNAGTGRLPALPGAELSASDLGGLPHNRADLRAEIERHDDRSMTVVTLKGTETITRCGVCPREDTRPCTALRVLALPYAQHPAYRPEWRIVSPDALDVPAQRHHDEDNEESAPLPYQRVADLPPPGNARRRALRQLGIPISRFDFTDEELARRGIAVESQGELQQSD